MAFYFLKPMIFPEHIIAIDHLCDFVKNNQKMNCMTVLATDNYVAPGGYVEPETQTDIDFRVPLPRGNLLGSSCIVPGVEISAVNTHLSTPQGISIPSFTYAVDRNLKEGLELQLPKLDALSMKAGPNFSEVSKIELSVDEAWAINMDENVALQAISSRSIKKSCFEWIKSQKYRVIGTALIAKRLNYKLKNSNNELMSFDAALKSKAIVASLGGTTGISTSTDATLLANQPRVIGVRFMPPSLFASQPVCESDIIYSATGLSNVEISGGGGKGQIGPIERQQKPIGETASLSKTGTEQSECKDGFERKISSASAQASVTQVNSNNLELKYDINANGRHYVTVAGCVLGNVVGKTGHDNTAVASASVSETIAALVRTDSTKYIIFSYENLPMKGPAKVTASVVDWKGERLQTEKGTPNFELSPGGSGSERFTTRGPGTYRAEVSIYVSNTVGGNVDEKQAMSAKLSISLE